MSQALVPVIDPDLLTFLQQKKGQRVQPRNDDLNDGNWIGVTGNYSNSPTCQASEWWWNSSRSLFLECQTGFSTHTLAPCPVCTILRHPDWTGKVSKQTLPHPKLSRCCGWDWHWVSDIFTTMICMMQYQLDLWPIIGLTLRWNRGEEQRQWFSIHLPLFFYVFLKSSVWRRHMCIFCILLVGADCASQRLVGSLDHHICPALQHHFQVTTRGERAKVWNPRRWMNPGSQGCLGSKFRPLYHSRPK